MCFTLCKIQPTQHNAFYTVNYAGLNEHLGVCKWTERSGFICAFHTVALGSNPDCAIFHNLIDRSSQILKNNLLFEDSNPRNLEERQPHNHATNTTILTITRYGQLAVIVHHNQLCIKFSQVPTHQCDQILRNFANVATS